jgi:UV excision repair protein RAD23
LVDLIINYLENINQFKIILKMKLTVKNLKGDPFDVIVEPSDTVKQVKERIEEEQKIAVDTQKLVAIGKVMADDKTIDDYKLKEGDFIVIMVSKPKVVKQKKPEPNPAPVQPSQPAPSALGGFTAPAPVPSPPVLTPSATTQPSSSASIPSSSSGGEATSGLLRGEALENTLKDMQEMGFGREE